MISFNRKLLFCFFKYFFVVLLIRAPLVSYENGRILFDKKSFGRKDHMKQHAAICGDLLMEFTL